MDRIHIPQVTMDDDISPGWISVVTGEDHHPTKPVIRCECGVLCGIGLHHVLPTGEVNNSFYHTKNLPGCGWHVHLFLDGYAEAIGLEFLPEP